MEKIVVICGPTGIGKTNFAINIAKSLNGEIISADSMQVYKHMNIGTAKPEKKELKQVCHHLIDIVDPKDDFNAGRFVKLADKAIKNIINKKKIPIVAGGTGLYIKALLYGLFEEKITFKKTLNQSIKKPDEHKNSSLYKKLKKHDPQAAKKIHPNDSFRVIRALKIYYETGKKISEQQKKHDFKDLRYKCIKIGLGIERKILYESINKRVDMMINKGLLKEVKTLIDNGYDNNLKSMQSIGYKHMSMFIEKKIDWKEAIELLKRDTRRYAKRQFTWFKSDKKIVWLEPSQFEHAKKIIKDFL